MTFTLVCLTVLFTSARSYAHEDHEIVKRQSGPACGGPYSNSVSTSTAPGTAVGTVTSTSSTGKTIWYTIPDPTASQYLNINPYTGVITAGNNIQSVGNGQSSYTFQVQSTDAGGGMCMSTVTLSIVGGGGAVATGGIAGGFGNTLGSVLGGGGGSFFGPTSYYCDFCGSGYYCYNGQCFATQDQVSGNSQVICVGGICYIGSGGGNNGFLLTSYVFYTSTCTAGTSVGTITAINANTYSLSSGQFSINSNGALTLNQAVSAGTYVFTVTSSSGYYYGGSGGGSSVSTATVTVSVNCASVTSSTTNSNCAISLFGLCFNQTSSSSSSSSSSSGSSSSTATSTAGNPSFASSSYAFTTSACTSGASVGTVTGTNVGTYSINYGSANFQISSSGAITLAQGISPGTYSATVVGVSSSGGQAAVPVNVNVVCSTG